MDLFRNAQLYQGEEKLVVSIDIGLTHSTVCYVHCLPNDRPRVRTVFKWPGQPEASGEAKVPNALLYKVATGELTSCGAEAGHSASYSYVVGEWLMIRVDPNFNLIIQGSLPRTSNLPTAEAACIDFMTYLIGCVQRFFEENTPNGQYIWRRLHSRMEVVLTSRDTSDSSIRVQLRNAAIAAGLVDPAHAERLLNKFTTDIRVYRITRSDSRLGISICANESLQAGSAFVVLDARQLLQKRLSGSNYCDGDSFDSIMDAFEKKTLRVFDGSYSDSVLHFGSTRDNDRRYGIMRGKLTLTMTEVARAFDDTVDCIIQSCQRLFEGSRIDCLFLTGSFGESPYLTRRIKGAFLGESRAVLDIPFLSSATPKGALIWRFERGDSVTPTEPASILPPIGPSNPDSASESAQHSPLGPNPSVQQVQPSLPRPLNPVSVQIVDRLYEAVDRRQNLSGPPHQKERLIVSFDIGTTCSAVSFVHMYPGANPEPRLVTRWPGQPLASGDSKVPTLIAYRDSNVVAYGAEALDFVGQAEYEIAQWFKLHLHPESVTISPGSTLEIPPLPTGVSLLQIYSSFLQFLYQSTKRFFEETTPGGAAIWQRLDQQATLVCAIPNGWKSKETDFLKQAAQYAGITHSEDDASLRMEFVTEGEASVHYILSKSGVTPWLEEGGTFAVVDAGGSTVDSTVFKCLSTSPNVTLEMVGACECMQTGGVFVDRSAKAMLAEKLRGSNYDDKLTINDMVSEFEKRAKRLFDGTSDSNVIQFGGRRDTDRNFDIIQGKLALKRSEVIAIFEQTIRSIAASCTKLLKDRQTKHLILVGGFGESPYLRNRLKADLGPHGIEVTIAEQPLKKAAAEGSSNWYLKQLLVNKVAPFALGVESTIAFDHARKDHRERKSRAYIADDGNNRMRDVFTILIARDATIESKTEIIFKAKATFEEQPESLKDFERELFAFDGEFAPNWTRDAKGNLLRNVRHLGKVKADLSALLPLSDLVEGQPAYKYWLLEYDIVVTVTGTKAIAQLRWKHKDRDQTSMGPIQVIPDF
ncbi:hypothetical protein FRC17_010781 [Serendipita sp. 399]|nr:hypothetical protein FRC17_010781 [Serendipita sp. 399]